MPTLIPTTAPVDEVAVCAERGRWALAGLPSISPASLVPEGRRAVVVTPDPDDEVSSLGGLIHGLHCLGRDLLVIAATGEARSQGLDDSANELGESQVQCLPYSGALHRLGVMGGKPGEKPMCALVHAGLEKNTLSEHETELAAFFAWRLKPGDVVFASWRFDGDPEHEAVGRAALAASAIVGAKCIPVPVRAWEWATPGDSRVPWHRARRIEVDQYGLYAKRQALFGDQLEARATAPISGSPGIDVMHNPYEIVLL
jgi:LmbE family N-acetylglucosaminyl deacetylase